MAKLLVSMVKSGEVMELMTSVLMTCEPEDTLEVCEERMQEDQVRRIPVVDKRGRCIGIVAQDDIALCDPAAHLAMTVREISKPSKPRRKMHFENGYFYCG